MKRFLQIFMFVMSLGMAVCVHAAVNDKQVAQDAKQEKNNDQAKAPQEDGLDVTIKLGPEFSSFSSGSDTNSSDSKNALGNQYFFTEIAARFEALDDWLYLSPQVRFGKINVQSDKKLSLDPNIPDVIKDASAIGGKVEVTAYLLPCKKFYFRAAPEFFYVYNNDNTKDVAFDSFFGFGIQANSPKTSYRDSYFEFGYGYSERLPKSNRFKLNLQLIYDLGDAVNTNLRPFIKTSIDTDLGRGADDIRVTYGVEIPATNIWKLIVKAIPQAAGAKESQGAK